MRVLHVMATGAQSGGANHLLTLLPALAQLGCECEAAVGDDGPLAPRLRAAGIATRSVALMQARLDGGAPGRVATLVASSAPDIVHYHGTRAAFFGALSRSPALGRPRAVYTVHGLSYRKERDWPRRAVFLGAEWLACRRADLVISVSAVDLADLWQRGYARRSASVHIPNAVDTARFAPASGAALRTELGVRPDELVVVTVSRLVPGKAVVDLVRACARCLGVAPIRLLVVGDGPERAALEAQSRALGVPALFVGERTDVPDLLRASDVFVLPSHWEGEPLALLEALAVGLPCISTATPGARDLLARTQAGAIVPVGDPIALAGAILAWAAVDPVERRRLGATGRALALERQPPALARHVLDAYDALLAR